MPSVQFVARQIENLTSVDCEYICEFSPLSKQFSFVQTALFLPLIQIGLLSVAGVSVYSQNTES